MNYKKNNTIFLVFLVLIFFVSCSHAFDGSQELSEEEMKMKEHQALNNKKFDSLVNLGWQLVTNDPDRVRELALEASMLSHEKDIRRKLMILNLVGITYSIQSEYDKAMDNLMEGLIMALNNNDNYNASTFYNNIGIINFHSGHYHEALQHFFKSIELYKKSGEKDENLNTLNNIGEIYSSIGNYDKAREYLDMAYDGFKVQNDSVGIASVDASRGKMYLVMGIPDSAVYYLNNAIDICLATDNKFSLSECYLEMAKVFSNKEDYNTALDYYQRGEKVSDEINYQRSSCESKIGMARAYLLMGLLNDASRNADEAMALARQLSGISMVKDIHQIYAEIYEKKGDLSKSLYHLKEYLQLKEKLNDQSKLHKLYNIEIQELSQAHDIQKLEIERQELIISKKNTLLLFLISAFVLLMGGLVLLYRNYRYRQDAAHQKIIHDLKEKKARAAVEAELQERTRIGQELHDGLGQMLTVARINMSVLQQKNSLTDERKVELLDGALSGVDKAFYELRNICQNLAPRVLSEKGLAGAIKEIADQVNKSQQMEVVFESYGLGAQLDKLIENTLFRAAQELIHNAIKHSKANTFSLQLVKNESEINMIAEDDGIGFDYENSARLHAGGLNNIKSRVEHLNGVLDIDTMINRGTIVNIHIPLSKEQ